MPVSQTRGQFKTSVWESLERDPRFESLLNEACTRAVQEVFAQSNFGNFKHETESENGRDEYNLPQGTLFVNYVTYRGVKLERFTFDEYLNRQSWVDGQVQSAGVMPDKFVVKDNRDLILSYCPRESDRPIVVYLTVSDDGFTALNESQDMPIAMAYTQGAWHHARAFLLENDGQDERAQIQWAMARKQIFEAKRLLNGSTASYVKQMY